MLYKVMLRLANIDLRDADARRLMDGLDQDVFLESEGPLSLATLYAESITELTQVATDFAVTLRSANLGPTVTGVHDELVSTPMIANRVSVGPEAVRLWVQGQRRGDGFPTPRQVIGTEAKPQFLFAWREVLTWVRANIGIDAEPDVTYPTDQEIHYLNHRLSAPSHDTGTLMERLKPDLYPFSTNLMGFLFTGRHSSDAARVLRSDGEDWANIPVHDLEGLPFGWGRATHGH